MARSRRAVARACGWLAACSAYFCIEPAPRHRWIAALGAGVSLVLIGMKLFWFVPGHFSTHEWIALLLWVALGLTLTKAAARRHALETYGPEAVKTGDKCFTNVGLRLRARTKRHGE